MKFVLERVAATLDNLHLFLVAILSPFLLYQLLSDVLAVHNLLLSWDNISGRVLSRRSRKLGDRVLAALYEVGALLIIL